MRFVLLTFIFTIACGDDSNKLNPTDTASTDTSSTVIYTDTNDTGTVKTDTTDISTVTDTDTTTPAIDADGDGYTEDVDCDDTRDFINPGMEEIHDDGFDNDCDPSTLDDDYDYDGFGSRRDCDNYDPTLNPGAEEIPGAGIDQDCNGFDLALACERMGWKYGSEDWWCPDGYELPDYDQWVYGGDWASVEACITDEDRALFDDYKSVGTSVGGCGCDWAPDWCGQPSITALDGGRHCGDTTQLQICVKYE